LILEISMGIAAFAYRQTLEDSFKNGLQNSMRTYQTIEENRDAVDLMQRTVSFTYCYQEMVDFLPIKTII